MDDRPIKTYAYYNGKPLVKTWDGDVCVATEPTTPEMISEHNMSPSSCYGGDCKMCVEARKREERNRG